MNELKKFSSDERRRYSSQLWRQSRGGAWFFGGMSALFIAAAILGLLGVIPLADDSDGRFLLGLALIVAGGCALLAWLFRHRRTLIDRQLQGGYRIVGAKITLISAASDTAGAVRIEVRDSAGASIAGGQPAYYTANVEVGAGIDVFVLADNVSFFSDDIEGVALGKLERPIGG